MRVGGGWVARTASKSMPFCRPARSRSSPVSGVVGMGAPGDGAALRASPRDGRATGAVGGDEADGSDAADEADGEGGGGGESISHASDAGACGYATSLVDGAAEACHTHTPQRKVEN